jgi:hypothetical protein
METTWGSFHNSWCDFYFGWIARSSWVSGGNWEIMGRTILRSEYGLPFAIVGIILLVIGVVISYYYYNRKKE